MIGYFQKRYVNAFVYIDIILISGRRTKNAKNQKALINYPYAFNVDDYDTIFFINSKC